MAEYQSVLSLLFRDRFSPGIAEAARTLNRSSAVFEEMQRATDRTGGALTEFTRFTERAGSEVAELARDAERAGGEVAALGRDAERAGGEVAAMARDADRAGGEVAAMGRDAERAGGEVAALGRDAERAGGEVAAMGRDAERAGRRVENSVSAASDGTRRSTGAMQAAWKGLDIFDDVGGVIDLVGNLTGALRDMAIAATESSREVESALANLSSVDTSLAAPELDAVKQWADRFALRREGEISSLVAIDAPAVIKAVTDARSAGLTLPEAQVAAEYAAGLAGLPDAGGIDTTLKALMRMFVMRDERPLEQQIPEWSDMLAASQQLFFIPSLRDLVEAVESSVNVAAGYGMETETWLAYLGAAHRVREGSEAGEALSTLLSEMPGGMEELGITVPETAAGDLDFLAAIRNVRRYRESRSDLSNREWMGLLVEKFNDEGGQELAAITGSQWEEFSRAIPALADLDGALVGRLNPLADTRAIEAEQLDVARRTVFRQAADLGAGYERAQNSFNQWIWDGAASVMEVAGRERPARRESFLDVILAGRERRAIPDTLAEGMPAGADALGAATSEALQTVDDQLPHSDARRGPLSNLTASGRAIPITLAEGVLQEAGQLTAAVTATLALPAAAPLLVDVLTGDLAPPAVPVIPPLFADILTGDLVPPAVPAVPPLIAEAFAADVAPPALPAAAPLLVDVLTGDLVPPAAPALPPLIAEAFAADVAPPALPTLMPLYADVLTGDLVPPAAPALPPLIAEAFAADVAPPALPTLMPLYADVLTGDLVPPAVPMLPPLTIGMLEGAPDVALPAPRARETGEPAGPTLQPPPALLAALLDVAAELRATRDVTAELRAQRGETRDLAAELHALRNDLRDQRERRPAPAEGDLTNGDAAAEYLAGLGDGA